MRRLRFCAVVLALALLAGGCGTPTYIKAYAGPELPKDQVALLKPTADVQIIAVNGDSKYAAKTRQMIGYLEVEMALPPGNHKIDVVLNTGDSWSTQAVTLELIAYPNRKYLITYSSEFYSFRPRIEDRTDRPDQWCAAANSSSYKGCKPD